VLAAGAVGSDGEVLAIDNAPNMLRALSADHHDLPRLATRVMDAHRLELPEAQQLAGPFMDSVLRVYVGEVVRTSP
jgi:hypothetical protein